MTIAPIRTLVVLTAACLLLCTASRPAEPIRATNVDSLYFEADSFKGMTYQVNLRGQEVLYRCLPFGSEVHARWSAFTVTSDAAAALFLDLERLGAFAWKERYVGDGLDGEGWSIQARTQGRYIRSFGSNAQPDGLGPALDRIQQFLGRFPLGFSGAVKVEPENCLVSTTPLRNHVWNAKSQREP